MCRADLELRIVLIFWHCFWNVQVWVWEYWEEGKVIHIKRTLLIRKGLGTRNRKCLYLDAVFLPLPFPFKILHPNESNLPFWSAYCWTPQFPQSNAPWKTENSRVSQNPYTLYARKAFLGYETPVLFFKCYELPALPQSASQPHWPPAGKPAGLPHFLLQLNNPSQLQAATSKSYNRIIRTVKTPFPETPLFHCDIHTR